MCILDARSVPERPQNERGRPIDDFNKRYVKALPTHSGLHRASTARTRRLSTLARCTHSMRPVGTHSTHHSSCHPLEQSFGWAMQDCPARRPPTTCVSSHRPGGLSASSICCACRSPARRGRASGTPPCSRSRVYGNRPIGGCVCGGVALQLPPLAAVLQLLATLLLLLLLLDVAAHPGPRAIGR